MLQLSEATLNRILSRAMVAIASGQMSRDRHWKLDYASAGCEALFGYTAAEIVDTPNLWLSCLGPDTVSRLLPETYQAIVAARIHTVDYQFRHKNGRDRWISTTITSHWQAAIAAWNVTLVATDITDRKQAELVLSQSNQQLRDTIASVTDAFYAIDGDWRYAYVNPRAEQLLQKSRTELLGQVVWDVFPEAVGTRLYHEYHRVMADRVSLVFEEFYPLLNTWFEIHAYPAPSGLVIYFQDVTERHHAYDQLQFQIHKEQAINRVIQVIRNSLELETIFATAATEISTVLKLDQVSILRYFAAESVWRSVAQHSHQAVVPECLMQWLADSLPISHQLQPCTIVQIDDVSQYCATPALTVPNLPGALLLLPLQESGTVWGALVLAKRQRPYLWQPSEIELAQMIADQLAIAIQQSELYQRVRQLNAELVMQVQERAAQLEQALDFEALLKRITDKVRDSLDETQILQTAVTELAEGLEVFYCNAGLYTPDTQTLTITYESIQLATIPPAKGAVLRLESITEIHQEVLRRGHCIQFCFMPQASGLLRQVEHQFAILSCPLMDDRGKLGDMWLFKPRQSMFSEMEQRLVQQVANQCAIGLRQARLYQAVQGQVEELERLNRLKDDFLSTVSHELRTPMSNVRLATHMLEITLARSPDFEPAAAIAPYLQILRDEGQREIDLIDDLLDLTRLDAGTEPLLLSPIELQIWLPHLMEPFLQRTRTQQQQLTLTLAETLPPLTTDLTYLERLLTELLQNACKYTPAGEQIRVAVQPDLPEHPNNLLIVVTNTGIEIPVAERERIFDKFYRIPNNDPWKHGGTGLGLALVKKFAEHLGARVDLSSGDRQTSFTVQIPLSPPVPARPSG